MVSALLSGVLLNCAFLAILRGHCLLVKAGLGEFSQDLLVLFGLVSMAVAAVFIIGQMDYKRLLAYSSVEHMGILVLGVGIGGVGRLRQHVARRQSLADQGDAVPGRRQHAGLLPHQIDARRPRDAAGPAGDRTALDRRLAGDHRIARRSGHSLSEFAVLKGMLDAGRWRGRRVLPGGVGHRLRRHVGRDPAAGVRQAGPPTATQPAEEATPRANPMRSRCDRLGREPLVVAAAAAGAGLAVLILGLYLPPALSDLLHHAARAVGAE